MYTLDWSRAHGLPLSTACFKNTPEDFHVNEFFDSSFTGYGEHILLKIEKKGLTTEDVAKSLAKLLRKPMKSIGYAGLKDKQALTTQWLSVHAPGEIIPDIEQYAGSGWRILECTRHHKKLRPGFLTGNQFMIRLRDVSHVEDLQQRIEHIKQFGVPNYFGEQRFGREAGNLMQAEKMLVHGYQVKDRFLKGIYSSAARSWIYNLVLSQRVAQGCWNTPLVGDVMQLSGSNSIFVIEEVTAELLQRIQDKDLSPASPLPGISKGKLKAKALELINQVYMNWQPWLSGLVLLGLEEAWRANILHVKQLNYSTRSNFVELSFILPTGSYATTVLRELCHYQ